MVARFPKNLQRACRQRSEPGKCLCREAPGDLFADVILIRAGRAGEVKEPRAKAAKLTSEGRLGSLPHPRKASFPPSGA
jgi:hypothetical protein